LVTFWRDVQRGDEVVRLPANH